MPVPDLKLLFVASASDADALALRREAELWRASAQLCETMRLERGADADALKAALAGFPPDAIVVTAAELLAPAAEMKPNGARLIAAPLGLDDAWLRRLRDPAAGIDALWLWGARDRRAADAAGFAGQVIELPEANFRGAAAAAPGDAHAIGFLIDAGAADAELEALGDVARHISALPDLRTIVVPSCVYYEITRLAPEAVVVAAPSLDDVVGRAALCVVADDAANAEGLAALAASAGRTVARVRAGGAGDAVAAIVVGAVTPVIEPDDRVPLIARIAGALRVEVPQDPAIVGARVARNLGITVETATVRYNPWVRVFLLEADIKGRVGHNDIGGRIEAAGVNGELVNAWALRLPPNEFSSTRIRAIATLRGEVSPADLRVTASVWGWQVAVIAPPEPVPEERAGLVGLNVIAPGSALVEYWGDPGEVKVQAGRKMLEAEPARVNGHGPAYFRIETPYPFNRELLTTFSGRGLGQKFTNFRGLAIATGPSSARVQTLRNRHAGKTAWIVGNGPSARIEDLDRLRDRITFGFNRFYLAHDTTRLRLSYTISGDKQMIDDFGDEIVSQSSGQVFLAHEEVPALSGDYCWLRQVGIFPSLFSRDASLFVSPGGSSLYVALQLGFYMGIRKFVLYGTDFKFSFDMNRASDNDFRAATGEGNHFIANYRSGRDWCAPAVENILPSFLAARLVMESEGGFIKNATRGGVLDVFDRIAFEDALAQTGAAG